MALIECPVCERRLADRARVCPNCGTAMEDIKRIIQERNKVPKFLVCPECGTEFEEIEEACPECGLPIEFVEAEQQSEEIEVSVQLDQIKCAVCDSEFAAEELVCTECGYPKLGLCKDLAGVRKIVYSTRTEAYLNEMMAECKVSSLEELAFCDDSFDSLEVYTKIMSYGDERIKAELAGYLDCIEERIKEAEMQKVYNYAKNLMKKADTEEAYTAAAKEFESVSEYDDASILACNCLEEAERSRKDKIYSSAKTKMSGLGIDSYEEAIKLFESISGWKDADELVEYCRKNIFELKKPSIDNKKIGDIIKFGRYEQGNGVAPIEWQVLYRKEDKVLILSKYALDCKRYNEKWSDITWEKCTLREWLNNEFMSKAFDSDEQSLIATTICNADINPRYSTNPGKNTQDKIFLLSVKEAEEYFESDLERKCVPTRYAKLNGAWESDKNTVGDKATCWWWLRSPGYSRDSVALVYDDGSVLFRGDGVGGVINAVRPALWIKP